MDEIKTDRLVLKKINEEDYKNLFSLWQDKDLIQYTYHQYMESEEDARQKVLKVIDRYTKAGGHFGPYLLYHNNEFVGYCGIDHKSEILREYEIFYIISKPFHGMGFATEVSVALTDYAFGELGAERVSAEVVKDNIASLKVLSKTGMLQEGCLRRSFYKGKDYHDLVIFGILKNEWFNTRN